MPTTGRPHTMAVIMPFYGKCYLRSPKDSNRRRSMARQEDTIWEITKRRLKELGEKALIRRAEELDEKLEETVLAGSTSVEPDTLLLLRYPHLFNKLTNLILVAHVLYIERICAEVEHIAVIESPYILLPDAFQWIYVRGEARTLYDFMCKSCLPTIETFGGHIFLPEQLYAEEPLLLRVRVHQAHKGDTVRLVMCEAVANIERAEGPKGLRNSLILYVDGTGISLESVRLAIQKFSEHFDGIHALLGLRGLREPWGISTCRKLIELLENYLISRACGLSYIFPDLQCGLWCLRGDVAKSILRRLEAHRFEIELDLAIELLQGRYKFDYVRVALKESEEEASLDWESEFYRWLPMHADKLSLIVSKFRIHPDDLERWVQDFESWITKHAGDLLGVEQDVLNGWLETYRTWVLNDIIHMLRSSGAATRGLRDESHVSSVNKLLKNAGGIEI